MDRRALVAGLIVGCVLLTTGLARGSQGGAERVGGDRAAAAIRTARAHPVAREFLARHRTDRPSVTTLDPHSVRVSFFRGSRVALEAGVTDGGRVLAVATYPENSVRLGSHLVNDWRFLALLALCFVLATAVAPLWRWRNLDALAALAFTASIVLDNERLVSAEILAGYVPLLYLGTRCLHRVLGGPDRQPSTPIYEQLTRSWPESQRMRVLALSAGALALVIAASTLTSTVNDVAVASMSGATELLHGVLPYGQVTNDVVHGDTYPLLAYASYLPAAVVWPVRDAFDNMDGALVVTTVASLATALALLRTEPGREGLRRAIAWLAFAPAAVAAAAGSNDIVVAAWLAWALALIARPGRSGALLAAAGWVKIAPLLLVPAWAAAVRRGGELRALAGASLVSVGVAVWLLALGGPDAIREMLSSVLFQQQRGSLESIWSAAHLDGLRVAGQAAALGLVTALAVHAWLRRAELESDPGRLPALVAVTLIAVQAAANHWSAGYVSWAFPALTLALFAARPHPAAKTAPARATGMAVPAPAR